MAIARFVPSMFDRFLDGSGITVPKNHEDPDAWNPDEYPHYAVFLNLHLGRAFPDAVLESNAKAIAKIPDDKILEVTIKELETEYGVDIHPDSRWD